MTAAAAANRVIALGFGPADGNYSKAIVTTPANHPQAQEVTTAK